MIQRSRSQAGRCVKIGVRHGAKPDRDPEEFESLGMADGAKKSEGRVVDFRRGDRFISLPPSAGAGTTISPRRNPTHEALFYPLPGGAFGRRDDHDRLFNPRPGDGSSDRLNRG